MNRYITSSETQFIANERGEDIEYLHLFLNPLCSFKTKLNGEELEENQIYIKAPTLSSADIYDIRKCSIVIAKFEEDKNNKTARELKNLKEEELEKLMNLFKDLDKNRKEPSEEEIRSSYRESMDQVFKASKSYQIEKDDFYTEFDKLTSFLQKRAFRMQDGSMLSLSFDAFNHLFAQKQFLLEAVFAEYVSFFSKHFPLESLSSISK